MNTPLKNPPSSRARSLARSGITVFDRVLQRIGVDDPPIRSLVADRHLGGVIADRHPVRRPAGKRIALTFDLDYQRDTDALDGLVDLVGRVGCTMSVCSIAALVESDPEPYRRAIAAGHEIVNHSWTHPDNPVLDPHREFWNLDDDEIAEQVARANELFEIHLGVRATGFRTPHFKDVATMIAVLEADPDTRYISSVLSTSTLRGLPFVPARPDQAGRISHRVERTDLSPTGDLLQLPLTACPEHRWSPFCSYHHLRTPSNHSSGAGMHDLATFERHWSKLRTDNAESGYLSFYFDPHDVMRDERTAASFERYLTASIDDGWEIVSLAEMADAWTPFVGAAR